MNISEYYKYSWFSDLAYVKWNDGNLVGDEAIKAAVSAKRAPQKLAEEIFNEAKENFTVLSYQENDEYGFAASLYGNGDEKVLAVRGTEPPGVDLWLADIYDIGKYGVSIHQAVSLFNYIQRLKAGDVQTNVLQLEFKEAYLPEGSPPPVE